MDAVVLFRPLLDYYSPWSLLDKLLLILQDPISACCSVLVLPRSLSHGLPQPSLDCKQHSTVGMTLLETDIYLAAFLLTSSTLSSGTFSLLGVQNMAQLSSKCLLSQRMNPCPDSKVVVLHHKF